MKFKTWVKLKALNIAKTEIELGDIATNKGKLYFDDDEIAEGATVYVIDTTGEYILPDNGDYEYGDNVATVENGIVVSIRPMNGDDTNSGDDTSANLEDAAPEDAPDPETGETVSVEKFNELIDYAEELAEKLENVDNRVDQVEEVVNTVSAELKSAVKLSKAEFEKPTPSLSEGARKTTGANEELAKYGL